MGKFRLIRIAAVLCLVLYVFYSTLINGLFAHRSWNPELVKNNSVTKWEKRIKSVLDYIPQDVKVVGYVADWDLPGVQYDLVDQDAEYVLTQYTLAPLMIQPGFEQEWIIGNFVEAGFQEWLDENLDDYEFINFGRGIYLIHRLSS